MVGMLTSQLSKNFNGLVFLNWSPKCQIQYATERVHWVNCHSRNMITENTYHLSISLHISTGPKWSALSRLTILTFHHDRQFIFLCSPPFSATYNPSSQKTSMKIHYMKRNSSWLYSSVALVKGNSDTSILLNTKNQIMCWFLLASQWSDHLGKQG